MAESTRSTVYGSLPSAQTGSSKVPTAVALYDYKAKDESKLSLKKGETVNVICKHDSGWSNGFVIDPLTNVVRSGWFPSSYITEISEYPQVKKSSNITQGSQESKSASREIQTSKEIPSRSEVRAAEESNDSDDEDLDFLNVTLETTRLMAEQNYPGEATTKFFHDDQLPSNWRRKHTKEGRAYYYNTVTNSTAWDLSQLNEVEQATSTSMNTSDMGSDEEAELDTPSVELTWDLYIRKIVKEVSSLTNAAKMNNKAMYLAHSNVLGKIVRHMLISSNCLDKDSIYLQSYVNLARNHYQLMLSISELVLAVKTASLVWPPPDAVHKMVSKAGQVLMSVRNFITTTIECQVPLQRFTSVRPPPEEEKQMSELEMINKLDGFSTVIKRTVDNMLVKLDQLNGQKYTGIIVNSTIEIVQFVGGMIGFLEDLQLENQCNILMAEHGEDIQLRQAIIHQKSEMQGLQHNISGLISAVEVAADQFAPPNADHQVMIVTTVVLKSAKELIIATKHAIEMKQQYEKNLIEQELSNQIKEFGVFVQEYLRTKANSFHDSSSSPAVPQRHLKVSHQDNQQQLPPPLTQPIPRLNTSTMYNRQPSASIPQTHAFETRSMPIRRPQVFSPSEETTVFGDTTTSSIYSTASTTIKAPAIADVEASKEKLRRFFGENVTISKKRRIVENTQSSYLDPDYKPDELIYSLSGANKIKGGTFPALVEKLTAHNEIDTDFSLYFLYTFRSFSTPLDLVNELIKRFLIQAPQNLSPAQFTEWKEKKQKLIQLRVYKIFKRWLEEFWVEKVDKVVIPVIRNFAFDKMRTFMPKESDRLVDLCLKRENYSNSLLVHSRLSIQSISYPAPFSAESTHPTPVAPKNLQKFKLLDIDQVEFARQLTIIESKFFLSINPVEFLLYNPSAKGTSSEDPYDHIKLMINQSNRLTAWVAYCIVSERDLKRRISTLKHFIKVTEKCHLLKNYATREAIMAALNSTPIYRLKKTWDGMAAKIKNTFETLVKFMDRENNFVTYRQTLKATIAPSVPFIGLYLTDITFIKQGNQDFISNGRLINFDKYEKLAKIVDEIHRFQSASYQLLPVYEIQEFIESNMKSVLGVQQLHDLSLAAEPREKNSTDSI